MESKQNFKVRLLGMFQASLNNEPLQKFYSLKTRALLAYLLVEANQPHSRNFLATLLWGSQETQKAHTNLRNTLSQLRRLLSPLEAEKPLFITTRQAIQLNLNPACHWVDVLVFNELMIGCEGDQVDISACAGVLKQATALYQGDFLSDLLVEGAEAFQEWRLQQQEKYHTRVLGSLNCLSSYYLLDDYKQNDYQLAEQYARKQLAMEPWYEMAHYQLMQVLVVTGQQSAALAQFDTCRRILAKELGAKPAPETVALAEQIKAGNLASKQ